MKDGKFFEKALLGKTDYQKDYEEEIAKLRGRKFESQSERNEVLEQLSFSSTRHGFKMAEDRQPKEKTKEGVLEKPSNPAKPFPRALRTALRKVLLDKYKIELLGDQLRFFTSVGCAALDDYNHTDAYFRVEMPGGERIITIDVSLRNKDDDYYSPDNPPADVVEKFPDDFQAPPDQPEEKDDNFEKKIRKVWNDKINYIALQLAAKLVSTDKLRTENPKIMTRIVPSEPRAREKKRKKLGIYNPIDYQWDFSDPEEE